MEYAERNGITIFSHYTGPFRQDRPMPGVQRMIKDSHKQLFDVVIVWCWTGYCTATTAPTIRPSSAANGQVVSSHSRGQHGYFAGKSLEGYAEFTRRAVRESDPGPHRQRPKDPVQRRLTPWLHHRPGTAFPNRPYHRPTGAGGVHPL